MAYRFQVKVLGDAATPDGKVPVFQTDAYYYDSNIGCFSKVLSNVGSPRMVGLVKVGDTAEGKLLESPNPWILDSKNTNLVVNPAYRVWREWYEATYLRDGQLWYSEELLDKAYRAIAQKMERTTNMVLIGDTLVPRMSGQEVAFGTREFVQFLIDKKIGTVIETPAILNKNYPTNPHLCQAWVWIPPTGGLGATMPKTVVHNEDALVPVLDVVQRALSTLGWAPVRVAGGEQLSKSWMERLVLSKKPMKKGTK